MQQALLTALPVLGIIVGSAISVLTTFLNNRAAFRKEHDNWKRQQEAENEKWDRERRYKTQSQFFQAVERAISAFTAVEALEQDTQKWEDGSVANRERMRALRQRAAHWVGIVVVKTQSEFPEFSSNALDLLSIGDPLTAAGELLKMVQQIRQAASKP